MNVPLGDANDSLATHLRARRKKLRLGQAEAARRAGVGRMAWYEWETGRRQPRDSNFAGIDEAMGWQPGGVEAIYAGGQPTPLPPPAKAPPLTSDQRQLLDIYRALVPKYGPKEARRRLGELINRLNEDQAAVDAAIERESDLAG